MDTLNVLKLVVVVSALCSVCFGYGDVSNERRPTRRCGSNGNGVCVKSGGCDGYPIPGNCGYGSVCCEQFRYAIPCQFDDKLYYGYYANKSFTDTFLNIFGDEKFYIFTTVEVIIGRFIILRTGLTYFCVTFDEFQSGPDNIIQSPPDRAFTLEEPLDVNNITSICQLCSSNVKRLEYGALNAPPIGFSETFCTTPPGCGFQNECEDFGSLDKFNEGCHRPKRHSYYYGKN